MGYAVEFVGDVEFEVVVAGEADDLASFGEVFELEGGGLFPGVGVAGHVVEVAGDGCLDGFDGFEIDVFGGADGPGGWSQCAGSPRRRGGSRGRGSRTGRFRTA